VGGRYGHLTAGGHHYHADTATPSCLLHGHRYGFVTSTSSCLLSFLTVPNLKKAVKQSNGHPNRVEQGAAGGSGSMSQHAESTQCLPGFDGFHGLVSNANTDVCVLHRHKRNPLKAFRTSSTPRKMVASLPSSPMTRRVVSRRRFGTPGRSNGQRGASV